MLWRMKGKTLQEIAGFAQAAQAVMAPIEGMDRDWPSSAARGAHRAPASPFTGRWAGVSSHGWGVAPGRDGRFCRC
ncbi:hypothetical protein FGE21_14510 [Phaeobacter sp. B1627]|nr:hypothetical protein FGE21_14510 [Phaeobacter sp. B1627]